jgi:uncharacterized membrane protein
MAVVLMVSGHTSSALLSYTYRTGEWVDVWEFQRGLTSVLFLLLAGFAFSVATARHWSTHTHVSGALLRRLRRFGLFIVLGYGLHFPVSHVAELATATDQQWRSFLAVDVLQLIGATFIVVQALVMIVRTERAFTVSALVLATAVVVAAPTVQGVDWVPLLPLSLAAYMSPATGSQFPLFPWAAFVLIGAATGQCYARWGAGHLTTFANWGMLAPGAVLIAGAPITEGLLGRLPGDAVVRVGSCLVILGILAHASRYISRLPRVFGAVAQESLLVYFVHLCVVYGSIWSPGLYRLYGEALTPAATAVTVAAVVLPMIALAWLWNGLKHARPRTARLVSVLAGAVLMALLL